MKKEVTAKAAKKMKAEITPDTAKARDFIQAFANQHKLVFADKGEVGFGRPCVGLLHGDVYVSYNPRNIQDYEPIPGFEGEWVPPGVEDAYHKHDCIAVLVEDGNYDKAILQLYTWVQYLDSIGVEVASFLTGATGIQAMISGFVGYAVKLKNPQPSQAK